jgi:hypothetical protein
MKIQMKKRLSLKENLIRLHEEKFMFTLLNDCKFIYIS